MVSMKIIILYSLLFEIITIIHTGTSSEKFTERQSGILKLRLVNIVFRHGDRAPTPDEMFPTDPNYGNTFFPVGPGGLTNKGKFRIYWLAQLIRLRYNTFLGDYYLPDSLEGRSTNYARTKMSLLLLFSGLYPPKKEQIWNEYLPWQPIPDMYVEGAQDSILIPELCKRYQELRQVIEKSPKIRSKIEKFRPLMALLTNLTGEKVNTLRDIYNLYHLLVSERDMGIDLPSWIGTMFPYGQIFEATLQEYEISTDHQLRKVNGGMLFRKMIDSMIDVSNGKMPGDRKMQIFSGHDLSVAALLQTLGIFTVHVPQYSSAVIIELYQSISTAEYYVRVVYYTGIPREFIVMEIPECHNLCSLNEFIKLYQNVTPSDDEMICNPSKLAH